MFDRLWFYLLFPGIPGLILCLSLWQMARARAERTRLPVTDFPRPAGWGLSKRTQDLQETVLFNLIMLLATGVIAAVLFAATSNFFNSFVVGSLGSAWFLWRIARTLPVWSDHKLGLMGEQLVGRSLDQLASDELAGDCTETGSVVSD